MIKLSSTKTFVYMATLMTSIVVSIPIDVIFNNTSSGSPSEVSFIGCDPSGLTCYIKANATLNQYSGGNLCNVNGFDLVRVNSWGNEPIGKYFFSECPDFTIPSGSPNLSKDLTGMFSQSNFNQPLDQWDVSGVTNMDSMFSGSTSFNQPLDQWDVSKVENMYGMFSGSTSFNQPLDQWDVSKVENMYGMFNGSTSFNQPLNQWDVNSVDSTTDTFNNATHFDHIMIGVIGMLIVWLMCYTCLLVLYHLIRICGNGG